MEKGIFLLITFTSFEIPDAPVPVQTEGDSAAPPEVLRTPAGSFWTPGLAPHVARSTSGVQTAEKSQSPKDDIRVAHGSTSEPFADARGRIPRSRSRQLSDSPRTGSQRPGKISSVT